MGATKKERTYRVTKAIYLSRDIKATSAEEARRIAEDLGESGADAYGTEWRARISGAQRWVKNTKGEYVIEDD